MLKIPAPMDRQNRIAELENEVLYLRHMIETVGDHDIRNLAASLILLIVGRIALLKKEQR